MKKKIIAAVIAVVVIILFICSTTVVPTGHTGIVTVFGKVTGTNLDAGFNFKAPWQQVIKMDNRVMKTTTTMEATSKDIQTIDVTFTLNYQIDKENASEIYRTIGTDYTEKVVEPQITNIVKAVMAQYTATELVTSRTAVASAAHEKLTEALANYNIEVVDTAIENLAFTEEFNDSVEQKVIAEQELERAQLEQEKLNLEVEQEAKRKVTEANGTAEANAILAESYTTEILQKMFIDKWDGVLPNVVGDSSTMLDVSAYLDSTTGTGTSTGNTSAESSTSATE